MSQSIVLKHEGWAQQQLKLPVDWYDYLYACAGERQAHPISGDATARGVLEGGWPWKNLSAPGAKTA